MSEDPQHTHVAAVEVGRVLEDLELLSSELRQAVTEHLPHGLGVVAKVDRVCKPSDSDVHLVLGGLDV